MQVVLPQLADQWDDRGLGEDRVLGEDLDLWDVRVLGEDLDLWDVRVLGDDRDLWPGPVAAVALGLVAVDENKDACNLSKIEF